MRLKIIYILFFPIAGLACKNEVAKIVIDHGISASIDLKDQVFTTYYQSKAPLSVKFGLTAIEIERINTQANEVNAYLADEDLLIGDSCLNLPKIGTVITIETGHGKKKISIDMNCDIYPYNTDMDKVSTVKKLVSLVFEIVGSKPEVKASPPSDRIYY